MIGPLEVVVFLVLSAIGVLASVHAWRTRLTYGFFRFGAFECLAMLAAWNARHWFRDPASPHQVTSWILLGAMTLLAAHSVYLFRTVGRARHRVIEDTEIVVEVGAYRLIRHPMYASLLLAGWAVFFKGFDVPSAVLAALATVLWVATARSEERFNIDRLGAEYTEYMRRTKMFVPFVL